MLISAVNLFSSLCKDSVLWKTSYLDIFNPSLFLLYTFKVTVCLFVFRGFGRILYFCSNNGPLLSIIFSVLYLKSKIENLIFRNWPKVFKIVDLPNFFLKLPEQCTKMKLENLLFMTYGYKTSYFEVAPPCHTMLTNTMIIYFKKKYVS